MRIALLAPLVSPIPSSREPQPGGSQALVADLAAGLAGRGHEVEVFAASRTHGISALCLSPGAVDTDMLREANPDLRPGLQPQDVAELIVGLLWTTLWSRSAVPTSPCSPTFRFRGEPVPGTIWRRHR